MNIVFVGKKANHHQENILPWRGEMYFNALQKSGLHLVDFIDTDLVSDWERILIEKNPLSQVVCIEGTPDLDLLNAINYLKSRGKQVIVDIPASLDCHLHDIEQTEINPFSISNLFTQYSSQDNHNLGSDEKYRWGLHLANVILVSTPSQQEMWQNTATVRLISEYVTFDEIKEYSIHKDDPFNIGLAACAVEIDTHFKEVIKSLSKTFPDGSWYGLTPIAKSVVNDLSLKPLIQSPDSDSQWPKVLSRLNLGIFWDQSPTGGVFHRNLLELMGARIPWILFGKKSYQGFQKYGLIIDENVAKNDGLQNKDIQIDNQDHSTEAGYLYAISQNIEDHLSDLLSIFSDTIKSN